MALDLFRPPMGSMSLPFVLRACFVRLLFVLCEQPTTDGAAALCGKALLLRHPWMLSAGITEDKLLAQLYAELSGGHAAIAADAGLERRPVGRRNGHGFMWAPLNVLLVGADPQLELQRLVDSDLQTVRLVLADEFPGVELYRQAAGDLGADLSRPATAHRRNILGALLVARLHEPAGKPNGRQSVRCTPSYLQVLSAHGNMEQLAFERGEWAAKNERGRWRWAVDRLHLMCMVGALTVLDPADRPAAPSSTEDSTPRLKKQRRMPSPPGMVVQSGAGSEMVRCLQRCATPPPLPTLQPDSHGLASHCLLSSDIVWLLWS